MPKILSLETDITIKTLSNEGYQPKIIKDKLKSLGIDVSIRSIYRSIRSIGETRKLREISINKLVFQRQKTARNKENILKVKQLAIKKNPESYRNIQKKVEISLDTIHTIIHNNCGLKTRKKSKVHKLNDSQKQNRKTNCRKLYQRLSGDKCEFVVTLDEAMVYEDYSNGDRNICYIEKNKEIPNDWCVEKHENFTKGFMIVGVLSGRGPLPLFRVPAKVKINAEFYINNVLKPLIETHLPKLYPQEMHKLFIHHDKASSHTAAKTIQYMEEVKQRIGVTFISKSEIPVKSPDCSPMDFFGFGLLKQKLFGRRSSTLNGIWKAVQEEWLKVDVVMAQKVFQNWKRRLRLVAKMSGEHIENTKQIHSKKLNFYR
jgi:hypothetical protein